MSRPRGGLGRGLGALIPTAPSAAVDLEEPPPDVTDAPFPQGPHVRPDRPSDMFFERTEPPESALGADSDAATEAPDGVAQLTDIGTPSAADAVDLLPASEAPAGGGQALDTASDGRELTSVPGAALRDLPIGQIRANPRQPRAAFDDEALEELSHSIREFGLLQPVVVRPSGDGYELVMGERRLRAAAAAGLTVLPAIVRDTHDDAMLRDALLENIHRAQLNPLEEAAAYQQLLEEFGVTHEQLAQRLGRSRSLVSNTVRLMNLSIPVQRRVAAGVLSAGHARALLALDDVAAQDDLAARIVAEGLSVRATEELVSLANRGATNRLVRRRSVRGYPARAVAELAEKLSDVLDTRVRVDIGQRKGKITVEFATVADLDRIVAVMAPQIVLDHPSTANSDRSDQSYSDSDDVNTASDTAQRY